MDLTYSAEHQAFRREALAFLEAHRHAADAFAEGTEDVAVDGG